MSSLKLWSSSIGEPKIVVSPPSPYVAPVGSQVTLACAVTGDPVPFVQWVAPISASSNLQPVETDPGVLKLVIEHVTMRDAGEYTCSAANAVGVAEGVVELSGKHLYRTLNEVFVTF